MHEINFQKNAKSVSPHKQINPFLRCFFPIVDCIADIMGSFCEVVVHDLEYPDNSIVKIRNGHVTGRSIGGSITEVSFQQLRDANVGKDVIGNYNPVTKNGRLLKSNAVNIRDPKGKVIGIICINIAIDEIQNKMKALQAAEEWMREFAFVDNVGVGRKEESFGDDLWSIIRSMVEKMVKDSGKSIDLLSKDERKKIIFKMNEKGVFYAKGSVPFVAKLLGVSTPTIYRHLEDNKMTKL